MKKRRNCGFVSYIKREDAAVAKSELNNAEIEGGRAAIGGKGGGGANKLPCLWLSEVCSTSNFLWRNFPLW
jgi:hypothetical protein